MSEINLVIMAAGSANRFGGIKQLTPVGPNGECLMDYSIFDAERLGFEKIIIVTNSQIEAQVEAHFRAIFGNRIKIELAIQTVDLQLENNKKQLGRTKPWGTGHALLAATSKLNTAFVICNADDFYGYETLKKAVDFLKENKKQHALLAYRLGNTMLPEKEYSRALAVVDENNKLMDLKEILKIRKQNNKLCYIEQNHEIIVPQSTLTSMNCWAFQYEIIPQIAQLFEQFLTENNQSKETEFLLPSAIKTLIEEKEEEVFVVETNATWFGLTYASDVEFVQQNILKAIANGHYPQSL